MAFPLPAALRLWLQERQYDEPYHWRATRNARREYALRSDVVLDLLGVGGEVRASPRLRLLDVGCGDGRFLGDAEGHADLHGVDFSHRALAHARRHVPAARVVRAPGSALPFADESFDAVTLLDVIEHIPDLAEARVMAEARRVLRPGGTLVVSTNTDNSATEAKHFRHYSLARFRALFTPGFAAPTLVGLIPYFPTLRLWMQTPLVWRLVSDRVRTCDPAEAQVVIGAATRR